MFPFSFLRPEVESLVYLHSTSKTWIELITQVDQSGLSARSPEWHSTRSTRSSAMSGLKRVDSCHKGNADLLERQVWHPTKSMFIHLTSTLAPEKTQTWLHLYVLCHGTRTTYILVNCNTGGRLYKKPGSET
jgi:hypothetical protein